MQKRIQELDVLRVFAMLFVITYHFGCEYAVAGLPFFNLFYLTPNYDFGNIAVTVPAAVVLSADETGAARSIRLRRRDGGDFAVRAAAIRPDACGVAATARRIAIGGWEIVLAGINAPALRAAEMSAWVEIDTDVPGGAQLRIPVRVDETEGVEP